ncbi:hypothetical protein EDEG_01288 [Edhazardia aedis USNM 41457]|uniref:Dynamin-type G domain-containing protein n=1 Tax=Edhazardia aedis (strain USNM 41457) TaxID=1003232 RepID=J9DPL2_EDHAE|nr:hypothetical protein EDEG_01288 [Edhazardia aedis USNM 41457]|eukprot:EJW04495.1 hypothetical protein EDEG_01288 [Edhazardia aedis USNM 41457]
MPEKLNNIEIFKRLQDDKKIKTLSVNLPRLVVIGAQSTGKSSVLESIINREILPKGNDLVTRCPLLINIRKNKCKNEYAIVNGEKVSIKNVISKIQSCVNATCGEENLLSSEEVRVDLYLNDCFELSLVDLPGLTKVPIGSQPSDIEKQVENMILNYIKEKNSLILAISSANVDLANSDSLKLSRMADPKGLRTIGILTKIDLMDNKTHCLDILQNKKYPLKYGYFGVVSRSQSDLCNKVTLEQSYQKENSFFSSHTIYREIYPNIGFNHLKKSLYNIFNENLALQLPQIKYKVTEELKIHQEYITKALEKGPSKHEIVEMLTNTFQDVFHDRYTSNNTYFSVKNDKPFVLESYNVFKDVTIQKNFKSASEVMEEIKARGTFFVSDEMFERCVIEKIELLYIKLSSHIKQYTELLTKHIERVESEHFSILLDTLKTEVIRNLVNIEKKLLKHIEKYMQIQKYSLNINHPDFNKLDIIKSTLNYHMYEMKKSQNGKKSNFIDSIFTFFGDKPSATINSKKPDYDPYFEYRLLVTSVESYYNIISKAIVDYVRKSTEFYLLKFVTNDLRNFISDMSKDISSDLFIKKITDVKKIEKSKDIVENCSSILKLFEKN